jgi:threonylcarbamoyladenosine tRNA methylthiotransferase CDKAL1
LGVQEGVTEIWLSSEDTGAFGRDLGSSISKLMDGLVALLPEDVMLRLGMTNPPFLLEQVTHC